MPSVLLIEDDTRIHKTLKVLFESEGYALKVAPDGVSGVEAFRSAKPSVVILDLKLPKLSDAMFCARSGKKQHPSRSSF